MQSLHHLEYRPVEGGQYQETSFSTVLNEAHPVVDQNVLNHETTSTTVLCKSNESEFRRISRHFATFRRKPTIFLTKRNIAELSTNFRMRYCLDTFEISKLYANVPAKLRTTIREDSRNFEGNISKFRTMLRIFEACFEVLKCSEFSRLS